MSLNVLKIASFHRSRFVIFSSLAVLAVGCGGGYDYGALGDYEGTDSDIVWPISRSVTPDYVSSTFGPRLRGSSRYDFHRGIDIPVEDGTPVYAIRSGVVWFAGDDDHFDDDVMQIAHCQDSVQPDDIEDCEHVVYSSYHHMRTDYAVRSGQPVRVGDPVGRVDGETLHFEIRDGEDNKEYSIHPLTWLPHDDSGAPDVSITNVDFSDRSSVEVNATVRRPPHEMDLVRVEVELQDADSGDSLSSQHYDIQEWNFLYTDDNQVDESLFREIEVMPEDFDPGTPEYIIHFRFFGLTVDKPRDQVRVVVRASDVYDAVNELTE